MKDIIQITRFLERIRIRIKFVIGDVEIYIKPDTHNSEEKFPSILFDYGILFRTKKIGDQIINVKLTEAGEHVIINIAEKHMHIGEMVLCECDNDTGDVTFKSESTEAMNLGSEVRECIVVNEKLRRELLSESV